MSKRSIKPNPARTSWPPAIEEGDRVLWHVAGTNPPQYAADEPAQTIATMTPGWYKAFLLEGIRSPRGNNLVTRSYDEPSMTIASAEGGRIVTRAYIVGGGDAPTIRFFARRLGHDCYLAETYYPYQPAVWCRVAP